MQLYHGSGKAFTNFSNEYVNTGEEVQKYGYGIYLTDSKAIAKYYADRAAGEGYVYTAQVPNSLNVVDWNESIDPFHVAEMSKQINGEELIDEIYDEMQEYISMHYSTERFDEMFDKVLVDGRNDSAWEELEEATEDEGYDLDKLRNALSKAGFEFDADYGISYEDVYSFVSSTLGGPTASKLMIKNGIDGFKFEATEAKGAINYTIFDASNIKIVNMEKLSEVLEESAVALPEKSDYDYYMDLSKDSFVHFTALSRGLQIIRDGKLKLENEHHGHGPVGVFAVSTTYGQQVPSVQHYIKNFSDEPMVAILFTTDTVPKVGFPEEVIWKEDVNLTSADMIKAEEAMELLKPHEEDNDFTVTYKKEEAMMESLQCQFRTFVESYRKGDTTGIMDVMLEAFDLIFNDHKDKIEGGKADRMTVNDIAKKHGVDVNEIINQLEMGIKVEMEHTDDPDMSVEIALDHLEEIPDYYTRLDKMEKDAGITEATQPWYPPREKLNITSDRDKLMYGINSAYKKLSDNNKIRFMKNHVPRGTEIAIYSLDKLSTDALMRMKENLMDIRDEEKDYDESIKREKRDERDRKRYEREMDKYHRQMEKENSSMKEQAAKEKQELLDQKIASGEIDVDELKRMIEDGEIDKDYKYIDINAPEMPSRTSGKGGEAGKKIGGGVKEVFGGLKKIKNIGKK